MNYSVAVIGAGLAGCEAAFTLAKQGIQVSLFEMRPGTKTPVHKTDLPAEMVCSNSFKSTKSDSAAGLLKQELESLGSSLYECAIKCRVEAGGALAVDRVLFSQQVLTLLQENCLIDYQVKEITSLRELSSFDAIVVATGPLTSDSLAASLSELIGSDFLAFYDAAAPIVLASSLNRDVVFSQNRYEEGEGHYLNAPFTKEEYERFADELLHAQRVVLKDFESKDLFQACQPIEEVMRTGVDAPRFGALKPVGLVDPNTGKRPWAVVQLRAEDACAQSYNLVGFQTNLTFPEQQRVFRLIPGLEQAEFARFGVMHRNTFVDAPRVLNEHLEAPALTKKVGCPVYLAGQIGGTEGYTEAIRSGLHVGLEVAANLLQKDLPCVPKETVFGALLAYATDENTLDYQPMHVNFGIIAPLDAPIKNKDKRYQVYAMRAQEALGLYRESLLQQGMVLV